MKKICIIGIGGFGREVLCLIIDILNNPSNINDHVIFMVDDEFYVENVVMGVKVIPRSNFDSADYDVVVAIADPILRKNIVNKLPNNTTYATLIHPTSIISNFVEIGYGSIIAAGVILTCNIKLGNHIHLNLKTVIAHDCKIGDYFTSAPGVLISGNCHFGECVYIGTNSSIKQGIKICNNVNVGMNSAVIKDIVEEGNYIGRNISLIRL